MEKQLQGKIALVTGASSGIGYATAELLAEAGAAVVASARRQEKLDELQKVIESKGGKVLTVVSDASKEEDVLALVDKSIEWSKSLGKGGLLDICIVNAGKGVAGGLLGSDKEGWPEMFELNVLGSAYLMRRVGELMANQGSGDIVALGSVSGHNISPFSGFYGSSKFALAAMTEAFRREICAKNIRVTTIKPGVVLSEFQGVAGYNQENFFKNAERFGKLLDPVDIARTILFVVSQPTHVALNEIVIRPTKQDYP